MAKVENINIAQHARKHAPRQTVLLLVAVGFVVLFYDRLMALDFSSIWRGFQSVTAPQWVGAAIATATSFWAVGRYDAVVHRILGTGMGEKPARRAGIAGIAISQTLGMGVFTGAVVRWRLLPDTTLWQATRLSGAVALSFLAGWAVVTGTIVVLFAPQMFGAPVLAMLPLLAVGTIVVLSLVNPAWHVLGRQIRWPTISAMSSIIALAAIDTAAAAVALYILLPDMVSLPFSSLYPAFLLALGAALISGTPGGVGAFEITLLAVLPTVAAEPLLGAVLAFRAVYYALPAILGMVVLARGQLPVSVGEMAPRLSHGSTRLTPSQQSLVNAAPFAEANLLRQGGKILVSQRLDENSLLVSQTGQSLVSLRDPLASGRYDAALKMLASAARSRARVPCLYKCAAPMAITAKRAGYAVLPIAQEAWLDPRNFTASTPNHRQLRRKLRKAKTEHLTTRVPDHLPLAEMADISMDWVTRAGGERGFSMGVFEPTYVQSQRCYLAYKDGNLCAFITINTCENEWALDLMRQTLAAPDGTMHALVAHAIQDAGQIGLPRFSLAAVPFAYSNRLLRTCVERASGGSGLRQFKTAFAPNWQTLYMAAPTRWMLCLAGFDIARAIANKRGRYHRIQHHYDE